MKAAVEKTAKRFGDIVTETKQNRRTGGKIQAHKHCRICGITISAKNDERVCKDDDCIAAASKDDRVKKQLRIWIFIFMGVFLLPLIASLLGVV